jgi:guanine deaminase
VILLKHEDYMKLAIQLAVKNVSQNTGGPFGAIIVKDGNVIGEGKNLVTQANDPTAHAEIQAIRKACTFLNDYQLTDCLLYTSCEPCPMCLGAIYWARPKAVFYACTKEDAATIGFDDRFIYDEIDLPLEKRKLKMVQLLVDQHHVPFDLWENSQDKKEY